MPRTNLANVAAIIEVDGSIAPNDAAMEPFITVANELVTEFCTGKLHGPQPPLAAYTDVRLELIERWLAAHMYTNRDPRVAAEAAGPVNASYQSRVDLGFDTSHYGQTAMRMDTNGGLARLNTIMKKGQPRVKAAWLGANKHCVKPYAGGME